MDFGDEAKGVGRHAAPPLGRRRWSAPRVILSELRSTQHAVGKTPTDKINFSADEPTPSGSSGS
ncbi:MAG TPA: hypothetical protein VGG29_07765 [Caulobacteraceae bacterium]|jgi:hypothetical protein